MLLQTGRGLEGMTQRQALNVTFAWMISRHPREMASSDKILEALNSEPGEFAADTTVEDLSEDDIESLLDSL